MAPRAKNAKQAVSARQSTGGGIKRFFSKESLPAAEAAPTFAMPPMTALASTATSAFVFSPAQISAGVVEPAPSSGLIAAITPTIYVSSNSLTNKQRL